MSSQREQFLDIFNSIDFSGINSHPNILIAARFWENDRYCAAKTCYRFMRAIDDLIDNYKASNKNIEQAKRNEFTAYVNEWSSMFVETANSNPLRKELLEIIKEFSIPLWPLEDFARSMIYDINNEGFPTLNSFLDYSKGASVAPASIFVHLNGLTLKNGKYQIPAFDVKKAALPCAIFSYLVHIIRDFQKDQLNNLNYFADDLIAKNNLTRNDLKNIADGFPVTDNFRELISVYYTLANEYRLKTCDVIKEIGLLHEPRYRLSLEIVFELYQMVFERINIRKGKFTSGELNPTPEETKERVYKTIMNFTSLLPEN